jgi:hypothetical protein
LALMVNPGAWKQDAANMLSGNDEKPTLWPVSVARKGSFAPKRDQSYLYKTRTDLSSILQKKKRCTYTGPKQDTSGHCFGIIFIQMWQARSWCRLRSRR